VANPALNEVQPLTRRAIRHARSRWLCIGLTTIGATLFLVTLYGVGVRDHRWHRALVGFASAGLALASFGLHNDTALALLRDIRTKATLPKTLAQELHREFIDRRQQLENLQATSKSAWAATGLAVAVQIWVTAALVRDFTSVGT
jgi:hypothetical protein